MDEIAKWFNYKRLTVGVEKERHSDMCVTRTLRIALLHITSKHCL